MAMELSGFTMDHAQPRAERLYLERSSRNVRFHSNSRPAHSSRGDEPPEALRS